MFNIKELNQLLDALDYQQLDMERNMYDRKSKKMKIIKSLQNKIENLVKEDSYKEKTICYYCYSELVKEEPKERGRFIIIDNVPKVAAE